MNWDMHNYSTFINEAVNNGLFGNAYFDPSILNATTYSVSKEPPDNVVADVTDSYKEINSEVIHD